MGWKDLLPLKMFPFFYSLHYTLTKVPPRAIEDMERLIDEGKWNVFWCRRKDDIVLDIKDIGNQVTQILVGFPIEVRIFNNSKAFIITNQNIHYIELGVGNYKINNSQKK